WWIGLGAKIAARSGKATAPILPRGPALSRRTTAGISDAGISDRAIAPRSGPEIGRAAKQVRVIALQPARAAEPTWAQRIGRALAHPLPTSRTLAGAIAPESVNQIGLAQ